MRIGSAHGRWVGWPGWVAVCIGLALPVAVPGQEVGGSQRAGEPEGGPGEIELLDEAAKREAAGELGAAEELLREALEHRAASLPALLSLERVLAAQGRREGLPALVRAALEVEPESPLLHRIALRTFSALDRVEELETAAEAWIRAAPNLEVPYREVAATWMERGDYGRARVVLERGRAAVGAPDALAIELGQLYAETGSAARAAEEWDRAIDGEGRGAGAVRRRLQSMPRGGVEIAEALVGRLAADARVERLEAALELALATGLEDAAVEVAESLLDRVPAGQRTRRLWAVANAADQAGQPRLAYWAYGRLAAALDGAAPAGGGEAHGPAVVRARLAALSRELDHAEVDEGVRAFQRGRLLLARGEIERARRDLLAAAQGLEGAVATDALALVTLVGRVSARAATAVGQALLLRDQGQAAAAVGRIEAGVDDLESSDAAPLLMLAARLADDAGLQDEARALRRRVVTDHPRAVEAPAALLELARSLIPDDDRASEARALLERLIVEYPGSALVPQARRTLSSLEDRGQA